MSVKPNMLKDDFTEKYYQEENPHNKVLFNPDKAAVTMGTSKKKRYKLPGTITKESAAMQPGSSTIVSRSKTFGTVSNTSKSRRNTQLKRDSGSSESIGLGEDLYNELIPIIKSGKDTAGSTTKKEPFLPKSLNQYKQISLRLSTHQERMASKSRSQMFKKQQTGVTNNNGKNTAL